VGCHGEKGDGNGPAAAMLIVKPRDFTKGVFKFRTTPSGSLPTDADIERTLLHGIRTTSMPEWSLLTSRDRTALVAYVKTFYPDWSTRGAGRAIAIPSAPSWVGSPEAVARGRVLYQELLGCPSCHGEAGRGDGPSAATMGPDTWGNPQRPANFTRGIYKSGTRPEDIYRTFMTGIDGTAMPSYHDIFAEPDGESILPDDAWRLVSYVLSFRTAGKEAAQ
jgi:mono/diheme cytochrome c family protein